MEVQRVAFVVGQRFLEVCIEELGDHFPDVLLVHCHQGGVGCDVQLAQSTQLVLIVEGKKWAINGEGRGGGGGGGGEDQERQVCKDKCLAWPSYI